MVCRRVKDENGTTYFVSEVKTTANPRGKVLPGLPEIQVWWARRFKDRSEETLLIRQENNPQGADVIELTLGQLYDMIHALNEAIEKP
jgi:hypothetical protein